MAIKKLIVKEFQTKKEEVLTIKTGYSYSYFQDPETGKYYRPKPGFVITGEDLQEKFIEIDFNFISRS